MKIDRSNYELWLIDLFDGNLNNSQKDQLQKFLNKNPDLKEEFDELSDSRLIPSHITYSGKGLLKKSPEDLHTAQFEYLCVANLENDILPAQKEELDLIIETDASKKETFELIRKLILVPSKSRYKHKNRLFRRSPVRRIIRFSAMALSAAATIALLISIYLLLPERLPEDKMNTAENVPTESDTSFSESGKVTESIIEKRDVAIIKRPYVKQVASATEYHSSVTESPDSISVYTDSSPTNFEVPVIEVKTIPFDTKVSLSVNSVQNTLIASNIAPPVPPVDDDPGRPIGRLFAKNFRGKILKVPSPQDNPLKGYEIAEAGVTGLNKLFGWEMALEKNKNENGELKSVYFSSRILKFNAPVKNAEPLP